MAVVGVGHAGDKVPVTAPIYPLLHSPPGPILDPRRQLQKHCFCPISWPCLAARQQGKTESTAYKPNGSRGRVSAQLCSPEHQQHTRMCRGEKREEKQIWEPVLRLGALLAYKELGLEPWGADSHGEVSSASWSPRQKGPVQKRRGNPSPLSAPLGLCNQKARFEPRLADKSSSP